MLLIATVYWFVWMWRAFGELRGYRGTGPNPRTWVPVLLALYALTLLALILPLAADGSQFGQDSYSEALGRQGSFYAIFSLQVGVQAFYLAGCSRSLRTALAEARLSAGPAPWLVPGFSVALIVWALAPSPLSVLAFLVTVALSLAWVWQAQEGLNRYWIASVSAT